MLHIVAIVAVARIVIKPATPYLTRPSLNSLTDDPQYIAWHRHERNYRRNIGARRIDVFSHHQLFLFASGFRQGMCVILGPRVFLLILSRNCRFWRFRVELR